MKQLKIKFTGLMWQICALDAEEKCLKSWDYIHRHSNIGEIKVEDKVYRYAELSPAAEVMTREALKDYEIVEPMTALYDYALSDSACVSGITVGGMGTAYATIELEDEEQFDPRKACLIPSRQHNTPGIMYATVICKFGYAGRVYDISGGKVHHEERKAKTWCAPREDAVRFCIRPTAEMVKVLDEQADKLPVLVFRARTIVGKMKKFSKRHAIDSEPWNEKSGVVVVTDRDEGNKAYVACGYIRSELEHLLDELCIHLGEEDKYLLGYDRETGYDATGKVSVDIADEYLLFADGQLQNQRKPVPPSVIADWARSFYKSNRSQSPELEFLNMALVRTIASVWSKSRNQCACQPLADPILIRQLDYQGDLSDASEMETEEGKWGNLYSDYLLYRGQMCPVSPGYVDALLATVARNEGRIVEVSEQNGERVLPECYVNLLKLGNKEEAPVLNTNYYTVIVDTGEPIKLSESFGDEKRRK